MYQYVKKSRDLRKTDIVYVMGGKCQRCGYNRSIHALECHHLNPDEKEFAFNKAKSISWETIKNELKKCVLLCANCHREEHDEEIIKDTFLSSSYDELKAQEVSNRINDLKTHKIRYCPNCGAIISQKAVYCVDCANKQRRITEWPDRETLKQLIRTLPFTIIAKQYNVTDNAVRKWCDKYNLPRKVSDIKLISDDDWLKI